MRFRFLLSVALGACLCSFACAQSDSTAKDSAAVNLLDQPQVVVAHGPHEMTAEVWRRAGEDTIAVAQRAFDESRIAPLLKDKDLDYDRSLHIEDTWTERFWRWIGRMLEKLFGSKGGAWVLDNLQYMVLLTAIVFVLWFLRKRIFIGAFTAPPMHGRQVTVMEENIAELDLDKLLRDAERERDWPFALRYNYLKVLKGLVDQGKIVWQPRYTDQDYLSQLKEPSLRAEFSELSFIFKWVWYGDAPMDEARYTRLKKDFGAFHQRETQAA